MTRFLCWILGHRWRITVINPFRAAAMMHLCTVAGCKAYCRRCGEDWDDLGLSDETPKEPAIRTLGCMAPDDADCGCVYHRDLRRHDIWVLTVERNALAEREKRYREALEDVEEGLLGYFGPEESPLLSKVRQALDVARQALAASPDTKEGKP